MPRTTSHRKSHRRSLSSKPKSIWSASMAKHGFHTLKHKKSSTGKGASLKNVSYALRNIIPKAPNKMNTSNLRVIRESISRVAKNTMRMHKIEEDLRRAREKEEKERKRRELNARRQAKAAQAASIANMENIFSKMHI